MAFLFGSWARGRQRPDSDLDVAVLVEPGTTDAGSLWGQLERLVDRDVDLVILNDASPLLAWEALQGERLLVRDRGEFLDYMLRVSDEAEDFREFVLSLWHERTKRGIIRDVAR